MDNIRDFVNSSLEKIPPSIIHNIVKISDWVGRIIYYQLTFLLFLTWSTIRWSLKFTMRIFNAILINPVIIAWNVFELFYKTIVLPIFYFSVVAGLMGIVAGIIVGGFALVIDSLLPSGIDKNRIKSYQNRLHSRANYIENGNGSFGSNELRKRKRGPIRPLESKIVKFKGNKHDRVQFSRELEDELEELNTLRRLQELRQKREKGQEQELHQRNEKPSSPVIVSDDNNNTSTEDEDDITTPKSPLESPPESPIESESPIFLNNTSTTATTTFPSKSTINYKNHSYNTQISTPNFIKPPQSFPTSNKFRTGSFSKQSKSPTTPISPRKTTSVPSTINPNYSITNVSSSSPTKGKLSKPKLSVSFPNEYLITTSNSSTTLGHYEDEDGYFTTSAYASPARRYSEGAITEEDEEVEEQPLPPLSSTNSFNQKKWNRVAENVWKDVKQSKSTSDNGSSSSTIYNPSRDKISRGIPSYS